MEVIILILVVALILFLAWAAWTYLPDPFGLILGVIIAVLAVIYLISGLPLGGRFG